MQQNQPSPAALLRPHRRTIIVAAVVVLIVCLTAGVTFVLTRPKPKINAATASQILPGMTEQEAEAIVGGPPGNYHSFDWTLGQEDKEVFITLVGTKNRQKWTGETGVLYVFLDARDRVIGATFFAF